MKHICKYLISYLFLALVACNSSDEKPLDTGIRYFPLQTGISWTYDVNEVIYDSLIQNENLVYQEKYEIVDSILNQKDEITYVWHVSKRENDASPWVYQTTWSARVSSIGEVIVNEENTAYLKILLPVSDGLTWKGNQYNDIESHRNTGRVDYYIIKDVKKSYEDFDNTITIQESDDTNLVFKDVRYSIYASQVGLVYRVNHYIDFCGQPECYGLRYSERTKISNLIAYAME